MSPGIAHSRYEIHDGGVEEEAVSAIVLHTTRMSGNVSILYEEGRASLGRQIMG